MNPFGTVSTYKRMQQPVQNMSISIVRPEPINPQTIVKMPKTIARKQQPRIHVVNHNKIMSFSKPAVPLANNGPQAVIENAFVQSQPLSQSMSMAPLLPPHQPQPVHTINKVLPVFSRPPRPQPQPIPQPHPQPNIMQEPPTQLADHPLTQLT